MLPSTLRPHLSPPMKRKAIAVIQHIDTGGVGHFGVFAEANGLALEVFHGYAGEPLPRSLRDYAGLCVLGGPMSANDDIPYLRETETLIRHAVSDDLPVIGHCLGGQLMARAFGARVSRAPHPEIGWVELQVRPDSRGRDWFGREQFPIYHWHHDSFAIPAGGEHLATSAWCEPQAFALGDRHIGMQFHCEITPEIIDAWLAEPACQEDLARHAPVRDSVQDEVAMRATTDTHIASSYRTAEAIYQRWAKNLRV